MARYKVILAYDGTEFFGLQRQIGVRTVQGAFEDALRKIGWMENAIWTAGRTDSGVHASGQVIAFDFEWSHAPSALQRALNANLPQDVVVRELQQVRDDFHPRFDAIARVYRYRIYCKPHRDPMRKRYAWKVWPPVDLSLAQEVADQFVGEHDFASFGKPPRPGGITVRQVLSAEWRVDGDEYIFTIKANAFLYHMVRRLVSFQVKIGQGKLGKHVAEESLNADVRQPIQGLAPPEGLCLVSVVYANEELM
jgi:tRNA pseudouridine38-40 synthase